MFTVNKCRPSGERFDSYSVKFCSPRFNKMYEINNIATPDPSIPAIIFELGLINCICVFLFLPSNAALSGRKKRHGLLAVRLHCLSYVFSYSSIYCFSVTGNPEMFCVHA